MRGPRAGEAAGPLLSDLDLFQPLQRYQPHTELRESADYLGLVLRRALRGRREKSRQGELHLPADAEPGEHARRQLPAGCLRGDLVGGGAPQGNVFANEHFYRTVQQKYPSLRVNPPAPACLR